VLLLYLYTNSRFTEKEEKVEKEEKEEKLLQEA